MPGIYSASGTPDWKANAFCAAKYSERRAELEKLTWEVVKKAHEIIQTGDLTSQISLRIMYPARASIVSLAFDLGNLLRALSPSSMYLSASLLA